MAATAAVISSTGDVLFLGSILLLIRCVCAGLVLCEVAEKSGMDPDGAGDVSQEPRIRTKRFSSVIHLVAKTSARVTASGRPSRTATTASVTEMMKLSY